MGKYAMASLLLLFVSLASILPSLACPDCPTVTPSRPPPPPPKPKPCPPPPSLPKPKPCPPPPQTAATCPIDTLKLSACVDILGGLVHVAIGQSATDACCPVIAGLTGVDAALCLCTTIRVKLLDIQIILPIALELLVDCGKYAPQGFQCPA